jgi:hypothetical protein
VRAVPIPTSPAVQRAVVDVLPTLALPVRTNRKTVNGTQHHYLAVCYLQFVQSAHSVSTWTTVHRATVRSFQSRTDSITTDGLTQRTDGPAHTVSILADIHQRAGVTVVASISIVSGRIRTQTVGAPVQGAGVFVIAVVVLCALRSEDVEVNIFRNIGKNRNVRFHWNVRFHRNIRIKGNICIDPEIFGNILLYHPVRNDVRTRGIPSGADIKSARAGIR